MRILAIDYGDARIGLAVSDPTGLIAGEAFTLHEKNTAAALRKICDIIKERQASEVVLGYPKNMNATIGERAKKTEEFAAALEKASGLKPVLWDERGTTVDALNILKGSGRRGEKIKNNVDAVAASLILESYLAYKRRNTT